ncbi:uncharacterized protein LOC123538934 [Mercenaria mercenaria]|uniref:uncharacterized protein LOC123538934 n=1 Tax=Mercenaria mercenaria TaxID=6596 RepID=UPI00234E8DF7|nr:uncharacterized protein LOC123538934 [Mercenaria mercenaria]
MSDSDSDSDLCVSCSVEVTENQDGISCDECERWTHRTCQSEISRVQYRRANRLGQELAFTCHLCKQNSSDATPPGAFNLSLSMGTSADFSAEPVADSTTNESVDEEPFDITRGDAQTSLHIQNRE